ncbi:MAG: hypothetical protein Fur0018_02880 [Anaerolineales bacterium]
MTGLDALPVLSNAAGFGGWTCPAGWEAALDAFVTNPISARPRRAAQGVRYAVCVGGVLLHTGHPNPGFQQVRARYGKAWARSPLPVWAHLLADDGLPRMLDVLEESGEVAGVEVRLPSDCGSATARQVAHLCAGKLPVLVQVPWEAALALGEAVFDAAGLPVSVGAPRGAVPAEGARGRLYGAGLFPLAVELVARLAERGLPVVASGGVSSLADAQALLKAGARGVQLDLPLWGQLTFPAGWSPARR